MGMGVGVEEQGGWESHDWMRARSGLHIGGGYLLEIKIKLSGGGHVYNPAFQ